MVEMMVIVVVVVMNGCFNYWLYRRFRSLGTVNRVQTATIRRLQVSSVQAAGQLTGMINELKVREAEARDQRDGFNRFLLKIVKDGILNQTNGNTNHPKGADGDSLKNVKRQGRENIVLHERLGFPG